MSADGRDVSLAIPAKPGFLVLARLALAAVCRLTALVPSDIADLKLAVTEAAGDFVAEDDAAADADDHRVDFSFRLEDAVLVMELSGTPPQSPAVEQELSHAIIEATVDEVSFSPGHTVLVKHL
jgi:anti-sigma regulatory factor (Ser/Thr protein kinase)